MDATPLVIFKQMNDQQYKSGVWNYMGLSVGPVNPGSLRCQCGTLMPDPDHPHTCVHLGGARIGRHDIRKNAWYRGMQHAGMSVSKQPKNRHLQAQGHAPLPGSQGYGNRGYLLGVSNKKCGAGRHLRSYNRDGREDSGGAQGGRQECQDPRSYQEKTPCECGHIGVHVRNAGTCYSWPFGRQSERADQDEACSHTSVQRSAFVRNLKTKLSVTTVKGNALVFQSFIFELA